MPRGLDPWKIELNEGTQPTTNPINPFKHQQIPKIKSRTVKNKINRPLRSYYSNLLVLRWRPHKWTPAVQPLCLISWPMPDHRFRGKESNIYSYRNIFKHMLSMCVYIYIWCICVYIYIYVHMVYAYIYIYTRIYVYEVCIYEYIYI